MTEFLRERNIDANAIRLRHQQRQNEGQASTSGSSSSEQPNNDHGERSSSTPELSEDSDFEIIDQQPTTNATTTSPSSSSSTRAKRKRASSPKNKQLSKAEQRRLHRPRRGRKNIVSDDDDDDDFLPDDSGYDSTGNGPRRRRRRRRGVFQNDENDETLFRIQHGNQGRLPGQTDFCARCHCKFTVTVYSEPAPPELQQEIIVEEEVPVDQNEEDGSDNSDVAAAAAAAGSAEDEETTPSTTTKKKVTRLAGTLLLCPACSKEQLEKGKKSRIAAAHDEAVKNSKLYKRKVAAAILDRTDYKNVPTLRSICIQVINDNVGNVETLGAIGDENRDQIARILAKNRKLDSESVKIFLEPSVKKLELWDCSQVNSTSLNLIPKYCPHLESLTLSMCGQLNSSFLTGCSSMSKLTSITLDGAFLVSSESWAKFFEQMGSRLTRVDIRNTHRFDATALQALVDHCAENLTHLTLSRMSGLDDPAAFFGLSKLTNLVHLEYSYPPQEIVLAKDRNLFTDEIAIEILNSVGAQLHTLVLDGCAELTDKFIVNGVKPCCSPLRMRRLSLGQLDLLSDEVVADLFNSWNNLLQSTNSEPVLTEVSLERCIGLGDDAVDALFDFAWPSLVSLNLSALPDLSEEPFIRAFYGKNSPRKFKNLDNLNLSFVRSVTNETIDAIVEASPWLEFIEVFGNPKINKECTVRKNVKLVGRQNIFSI